MVKAPSHYSPTADVDAAIARARVVLKLMEEQGKITPEQAAIDPSTVNLKREVGGNSVRYFTDWALPQLDLLIPQTNEPIQVWTTLDPGMQKAAAAAVEANTPKGAQGALVSMDRDGAVLALIGGTDYVKTSYNRATDAVRQPGSAWKLFVYLSALEAGYKPDDTVVDTPVTIDGWSPKNSEGRFVGQVDLRSAFAYSINTVAAQLGNEVGFGTVASMARRLGISTPISTYPSMVLGSNEVRLLDMTRAYAIVGDGGRSVEPYGIVKVTSSAGEVLYQREAPAQNQLIPDYVDAQMIDLLQTAVNTGTGRAAQIGRPVAGKTGTTSSNKDGYFVGFSSGVTTGVWMGRDDNRAVGGLYGGTAPAKAFSAFMRYAVKDRPVQQFQTQLKMPGYQLEPDQEQMQGNPDDYYFIDDQGNLIERGTGQDSPVGSHRDQPAFPVEGEQGAGGNGPGDSGNPSEGPQAASDDFLRRATGGAGQQQPMRQIAPISTAPTRGPSRSIVPSASPAPRTSPRPQQGPPPRFPQ